jgi:single-strand DNA-binding protein
VQIIGNLGRDPEMRFTQDGTPVTNFSVAVNDSWQGRDGEQRERTEWFKVVAWRRLAEISNEYLQQGRKVYVEGRLETQKWQDREGNDRYTTELVARDLLMLGGRDNEDSQQIQPENDERPVNDDEITADDLPF